MQVSCGGKTWLTNQTTHAQTKLNCYTILIKNIMVDAKFYFRTTKIDSSMFH